MARVFISKRILTEIAPHDGLSKNLQAFLEACKSDKPVPRIYKPSGTSRDGREFLPYVELDLHHHHLHNNGDPLLVTQHVDGDIYVIGLARHADYILGDKMQWLKDHAHLIDWSGCEHHHQDVQEYLSDDDIL